MGNLTRQVHKIQGLNLRTNQLSKDDSFATEAENVELTAEGYLTKRKGFAEHSAEADFIQLMDYVGGTELYVDGQPIELLDQEIKLLGLKADGLYGYDTKVGGPTENTWVKVIWANGVAPEPTFSEPVSWAEFEGVIYMADPSGVNDLLKFDGTFYHRASLPKPIVNLGGVGGAATAVYVKVIYEYIDLQGNVIVGEDWNSDSTISTGFKVFFDDTAYLEGGFPQGYNIGGEIDPLTIMPTMIVAISQNPTFGFVIADRFPMFPSAIIPNYTITSAEITTALADGDLLSDIYDYTIRKGLPPKAKYLDFYNGLMVLGNFKETYSINGAGEELSQENANFIAWSDLSTGGSVEVFPSLNQQAVGKSDAVITGIFGESDNLIIFKNRNVFYLSGDLVNGNYRLRDSLSEGIGCVAHQSIIKVEGGAVFLSEKGIYMAKDGYKPIEFSDIIEPLFTRSTDLLFSKSVAVLDRLNERVFLFIPSSTPADSIVVQYDYYHKQWFTYKGFDASGGFTMSQDELVHTNGTKVFLRNDARNDDGVAISARYATSWFNLGKPSLKKKFTNFLAFSLDQSTWKLTVNVERDWQPTADTTAVIQFPSVVGSEDVSLPAKQCHSMRIILSNAELDENIMINGYNYEFAETQERFKGGD